MAYVVTSVLVLMLTIVTWRTRAHLALKFTAFVLATILVSPHLITYDLVLALTALLPLWGWLRTQSWEGETRFAAVLIYLVYFLPAVYVVKLIYLQLTTVAMVALLIVITHLARRDSR